MKRNLRTSATLIALSVAGLLSVGQAQATSTFINVNLTLQTGYGITPETPASSPRAGWFVGTGTDADTPPTDPLFPSLPNNNGVDTFNSWCLEPMEYTGGNATYELVDLYQAPNVGANGPMGATRAGYMETLVLNVNPALDGDVYDPTSTYFNSAADQQILRDAFQLALWEIANEDSSNSLDVTSGEMYATSSSWMNFSTNAKNLANTWLGLIVDGTWLGDVNNAYAYAALTAPWLPDATTKYQDQIVLVSGEPEFSEPEVPLPAAAYMFLPALMGFSYLARRKAKA
jgi:hypothetical protein